MKNSLFSSIRHIKLISLLGVTFVGSSLLSGCAGVMHRLGYIPIPESPSKACVLAPLLITNLKAETRQRRYQLLNGHACLEINDYEQTQLQKAQSV